MSTPNGTRRASRRQSQDADKVVVNLVTSPPAAGSRRGVSTSNAGARTSPIDVEALEDEVQVVSASQVPPQVTLRGSKFIVMFKDHGVYIHLSNRLCTSYDSEAHKLFILRKSITTWLLHECDASFLAFILNRLAFCRGGTGELGGSL